MKSKCQSRYHFFLITLLVLSLLISVINPVTVMAKHRTVTAKCYKGFHDVPKKVNIIKKTGTYTIKTKSPAPNNYNSFVAFKAPSTGRYKIQAYGLKKLTPNGCDVFRADIALESKYSFTDFVNKKPQRKTCLSYYYFPTNVSECTSELRITDHTDVLNRYYTSDATTLKLKKGEVCYFVCQTSHYQKFTYTYNLSIHKTN